VLWFKDLRYHRSKHPMLEKLPLGELDCVLCHFFVLMAVGGALWVPEVVLMERLPTKSR
jgi:hypothetical protein